MRARILLLATILSASLLHSTARADTKSWAAIKGKMPADATLVISGNVVPVRSLEMYSTATQAILNSDSDLKEAAELIKSACKIDVATVISDFTVVASPQSKAGVVVLGVEGVDSKKALACANLMSKAKSGGAISGKARGKITEYAMKGEKEKLYAAWLTKDVIAIATDPTDRAMIGKLVGGKGAKGDLATALGKTNTGVLFWGASGDQEMGMDGELKSGFFTVELAAGKFTFNGHATMPSAALAKSTVADVQSELKKERKDMPPAKGTLVDRMTLIANEAEIVISGWATEAELGPVLGEMMK